MYEEFEILTTILFPLFLGAAAAVARLCRHGWRGLAHFARELFLCGFYGVLIFWMLDIYDFPPTVKAAITGAGAYAALELGNALFGRLEKMINELQMADLLPWAARNRKEK